MELHQLVKEKVGKEKISATDLLEIVSRISEKQWITENFTNGNDKCCFVGHIYRLSSKNPNDYSKENLTNDDCNESIYNKLGNLIDPFNEKRREKNGILYEPVFFLCSKRWLS